VLCGASMWVPIAVHQQIIYRLTILYRVLKLCILSLNNCAGPGPFLLGNCLHSVHYRKFQCFLLLYTSKLFTVSNGSVLGPLFLSPGPIYHWQGESNFLFRQVWYWYHWISIDRMSKK
jgi:hypothetical protein